MIKKNDTPWKFICLMATLMSFIALAIDAMLPALDQIRIDLKVENANDVQLVISSIFLGMSLGLMFFGPFSDSYGRRPAIFIGMAIFTIGCLISLFSQTFTVMIAGRVLQGLGASSCRIITLAMIRDKFEGDTMAKIMSLIMIVFILVPALAPAIGQGILLIGNWRSIFVVILSISTISTIWFAIDQEETLDPKNKVPFSLNTIYKGILETIKNELSRKYTLASGVIFGSFVGYLSTSQQILQVQYNQGQFFPVIFGILALSIGFSSFVNSKLVERFGMEFLSLRALKFLILFAFIFLPYNYFHQGHPPLITLTIYLILTFFCFGILFGNFTTLAVKPLGHIAGVASSVIASIQTFISVGFGATIGYYYDNTVLPLNIGFLILGMLSLFIVKKF